VAAAEIVVAAVAAREDQIEEHTTAPAADLAAGPSGWGFALRAVSGARSCVSVDFCYGAPAISSAIDDLGHHHQFIHKRFGVKAF
jgi:hypothetical protein